MSCCENFIVTFFWLMCHLNLSGWRWNHFSHCVGRRDACGGRAIPWAAHASHRHHPCLQASPWGYDHHSQRPSQVNISFIIMLTPNNIIIIMIPILVWNWMSTTVLNCCKLSIRVSAPNSSAAGQIWLAILLSTLSAPCPSMKMAARKSTSRDTPKWRRW